MNKLISSLSIELPCFKVRFLFLFVDRISSSFLFPFLFRFGIVTFVCFGGGREINLKFVRV